MNKKSMGISKKRQVAQKTCGSHDLNELITAFNNKSVRILGRNSKVIVQKLRHLSEMIGLQKLKTFVACIVYMVCAELPGAEMFMNICITGEPGCGKTDACNRIASLIQYILFGNNGHVVTLNRCDLVGRVLGETAIKTKMALIRNKNKCIFIDEIYSLGNNNSTDKDSFSKECIDTICGHLSEYVDSCSVIIAGYTAETEECFFQSNPGLVRRFPWRFEFERYNADELVAIFSLKMSDYNVEDLQPIREFFDVHKCDAADVMKFISNLLLCHSKSVVLDKESRLNIGMKTIKEAFAKMTKVQKPLPCAHMFL